MTMFTVDGDGWLVAVGDKDVVLPVGPQGGLFADQAGAAHYETDRGGWKPVMAASRGVCA